jgi:hypothetical protein
MFDLHLYIGFKKLLPVKEIFIPLTKRNFKFDLTSFLHKDVLKKEQKISPSTLKERSKHLSLELSSIP